MRIALLLLLIPTTLLAQPLKLVDLLQRATPGDYWVTSEGQNQTLLLIREQGGDFLVLDEITRPNRNKIHNWKTWVEEGASQNTSWISHCIDLTSGTITHSYSHTKGAWVKSGPLNTFLSTLFCLPFQPMNNLYRRRVGPITAADPMSRPLWQPRLTLEGQVMRGIEFDAWCTQWPSDQTELAGKGITIYLPKGNGNYPKTLPYWVEINDTIYTAKLRVIDSGRDLSTSSQTVSTTPFRHLFPSSH